MAPGPNDTNYINPTFDNLYEQIAALAPSERRNQLIKKAEALALEDGVWSMLFYPQNYVLYQGWVRNLLSDELVLNSYKYLDIDAAAKQELSQQF